MNKEGYFNNIIALLGVGLGLFICSKLASQLGPL